MALLALNFASAAEVGGEGQLASYVARPDASFGWREVRAGKLDSVSYVELVMTSQTWQSFPWKHQLFLLRPDNVRADTRQALLFIHGGRWRDEYEAGKRPELPREARLFARLAHELRAPVGILRQVPYQPLFGRKEDQLIAFTFDRYLETGESEWPLLLPMVKSAVRAMDVIQEVALQRWTLPIEAFTVTGASKRGWATWLTAAIDPRVIGLAPIVIDVLNMQAQMVHQRETWGDLSEQIGDYSQLDLPRRLSSQRGRELLAMVDPYSYRQLLTQPKLVLLSTNDRYWPLDALKLYWSGLPEQKHVLYVPNQGHSLRDVGRVIGALSALHRYAAARKPLPQLSWKFVQASRDLVVTVQPERVARRVITWYAHSRSRDFRDAHWVSRLCARARGQYVCRSPRAAAGYTAAFAEATFLDKGEAPFSLSTTVCIAGPRASLPSTDC
jgi:PhoPQ-activated pathogenicity-related protein